MKTEIICAIITMSGMVLSAAIAWFVSRLTANKEIEKMKLVWKREDVVSSDEEFADMASAVAAAAKCLNGQTMLDASRKVSAIRSKESGVLGEKADELYMSLNSCSKEKIDRSLTEVIEEKRKAKNGNHA